MTRADKRIFEPRGRAKRTKKGHPKSGKTLIQNKFHASQPPRPPTGGSVGNIVDTLIKLLVKWDIKKGSLGTLFWTRIGE